MPNWEAIEDPSPNPTIWLWRAKETDTWKPLRKVDCRALNDSHGQSVQVEGGRATADPASGVVRYNFYDSPSRALMSATWFVKEPKGKEFILHPMSSTDARNVENLYQNALKAASSLGDGVDSILKEDVILEDEPDFKVVVNKVGGGALMMKKRPRGGLANMFGPVNDVQRGYGAYTVEGEEEELALGPVRHLIFVVHGVGEAMWSRDDVNVPSMQAELDRARTTIHKKQVGEWKLECEKAKKADQTLPSPPNKIELLPIEWHERIHSPSNALIKSLKSCSLRTIPALRAIANDVVFDVLMYLTPEFCEIVLECVTAQINKLYEGFQRVHKGFVAEGGKCSLVGHSLGSMIVWDLLALLKKSTAGKKQPQAAGTQDNPIILFDSLCGFSPDSMADCRPQPTGYQAFATDHDFDAAKIGSWGPSLPKKMDKTIPFVPDFTFFLGSPIGLFLTLRGAHAVFNEMMVFPKDENSAVEKLEPPQKKRPLRPPPSSSFTLPSGSIYNIFHPSDPVAYRIEPLLLPQETIEADIPPPAYLLKEGQGVRLHVKAMQIGDDIKNKFFETRTSFSGFFSNASETSATPKQGEDATEKATGTVKKTGKNVPRGSYKFALGGKSDRVDFQLQTGVIENEYLSAVSAHSSYFTSNDVLDFVIQIADVK